MTSRTFLCNYHRIVCKIKQFYFCNIQVQKKVLETKSEAVLFEEEENTGEVMAGDTASCCLDGSLSSQYGADTSILYHQLDLHSREQKVNQIVLLKVTINLFYCSDTVISVGPHRGHSHC